MTRVLLMSDTHGCADEKIIKYLDETDEIWHAGDIGSLAVVETLERHARLRAVRGNIDDATLRSEFPANKFFETEGQRVLMLHIGGYPGKYSFQAQQLIAQYRPTIFVCGHSHILRVIYDRHFNMLTLNPGAAGLQGFHQVRTMLKFTLDQSEIKDMSVIEFPRTFAT